MAVGRSSHCGLRRDLAGGARSVLHDKRLAEPLGQPLTQQASEYAKRAAGAKALDQVHWTRRVSLRLGDRHQRCQGDSTACA